MKITPGAFLIMGLLAACWATNRAISIGAACGVGIAAGLCVVAAAIVIASENLKK